jgi:hypothetical protein
MRYMILLTLLTLALTACGAAPQAAAPSQAPVAPSIDAGLATAVPAATAASTAAPTRASLTATPQESAVPDTAATPQSSSPIAPAIDRTARPAPAVERVPTTPPAAAVVGEVPADLLGQILADAAQRSGVDVASIVVERGEAVEWSDGSLGCPRPGMVYLQVITPGYHVVLQAGGSSYDYRADERGRFLLCQP